MADAVDIGESGGETLIEAHGNSPRITREEVARALTGDDRAADHSDEPATFEGEGFALDAEGEELDGHPRPEWESDDPDEDDDGEEGLSDDEAEEPEADEAEEPEEPEEPEEAEERPKRPSRTQRLKGERDAAREQAQRLETNTKQLSESNAELDRCYQDAEAENDDLRAENAALVEELGHDNGYVDTLEQRLAELDPDFRPQTQVRAAQREAAAAKRELQAQRNRSARQADQVKKRQAQQQVTEFVQQAQQLAQQHELDWQELGRRAYLDRGFASMEQVAQAMARETAHQRRDGQEKRKTAAKRAPVSPGKGRAGGARRPSRGSQRSYASREDEARDILMRSSSTFKQGGRRGRRIN